MPVQPDIALQAVSPNPTNFISSFIDLGQKKLNLDKTRETFDSDVAQRKAESSSAQSAATVNAANVQPLIAQQAAVTSTAQSGATGAKNRITADQAAIAFQHAGGLMGDPAVVAGKDPEAVAKAVIDAKKRAIDAGLDPLKAEVMFGRLVTQAHDSPGTFRAQLNNLVSGNMPASSQQAAAFPAPALVSNGQQTLPIAAGNPALTGVPAGTPQGVPVQQQVPPTAPTMVGGQPGYVGPQAPQAPGAPMRPSGPALGQAEGVQGQVAPMVQHYQGIVQAATDAPQRIGILQEIKALAPEAITGDAPTLKKVVSKLAAYTGWTGSEQTPTDVMAKEAALLASKGGNTDMARLLNEAATPNGHMTKEAIQRTADQLIGIEKRNAAAQPYFAGTPPDSPVYAQKKAAWDQNADPRAFEYAAKDPADQAKMKAAMQKAGTWDALRKKMVQLHAMGVNPE